MEYKSLLKFICMLIISIAVCVFCIQTSRYKSCVVPGTIVSKNIEQYAYGKRYRNISERYVICVKPDEINKFKHYSAYVDYTTYCTHNIGDKIECSISEDKCIRDFKYSIWVEKLSCIMFIIFSFFALIACVSIIVIIGESYESYRDDLL